MNINGTEVYLEPKLQRKLDLMIDRTTNKKFDNLVLIDGDEGYGKSNLESLIAYYVHQKTGRTLSLANLFFSLDKLTEFAQKTEEQIILWDEGALGGLALEWWNKNQQKFLKLLMVCRKKRHFFIICIPKFFKLNEYLVIDRSIALIHVYARNETQLGRFAYFDKKSKESLYESWRRTRKRGYKRYMSFHGSFRETLPLVFNEEEYEKKKDEAIITMDEAPKNARELKWKDQRDKLIRLFKKYVEQGNENLAVLFENNDIDIKSSQISRITREIEAIPLP